MLLLPPVDGSLVMESRKIIILFSIQVGKDTSVPTALQSYKGICPTSLEHLGHHAVEHSLFFSRASVSASLGLCMLKAEPMLLPFWQLSAQAEEQGGS